MAEKSKLSVGEVKFWLSEANSCVERQKIELIKRNNYPNLIHFYEGVSTIDPASIYPHVSTDQQLSVINEFFPSTNSLISELMYQNPDILVEPMKQKAEDGLHVMRSALNYLATHSDSLTEYRVALFDMLFAGYCAIEVDQMGVNNRKEYSEETIPEEPKSVFDKFKKGFNKITNPQEAEKHYAKLAPEIESNFATVQGTYIRRYSPLDVPLDWRAERVKDRRYNLKKVWMSKAEFDVKYPKFSRVGAEEDKFRYSRHDHNIHNSKVLLYEFQVRMQGNKYVTIIVSPQEPMRELDYFERKYVTNNFNMKIGTLHKYGVLYPISFAQINKKMEEELNNYTKHLMDVAERNVPKHLVNAQKIKASAQDALRSTKVNDIVEVDGNTSGCVEPLHPSTAAFENKELLGIFQDQKNKLWSVSESKISGRSTADFATDIAVQEASNQQRNVDVQEGLRKVIREVMDTGKDLIVTFWDGEVWLRVTGEGKIGWYEPIMISDPRDPSKTIVENPLTDELTGDYFIDIDIASSVRPNKQQKLANMTAFMKNLIEARQLLIDQGKDINIDEIRKLSKEFGWNPETIFVDYQPQGVPNVPTPGGENISPEEDARRQAEAEAMMEQVPERGTVQ